MSQWQSRRGIWLSSSLQLESLKTGTAAQASGMAAHYFKEAPKRAHFLLREYASHLNNQSQAAFFMKYVIVPACNIISQRTFSDLLNCKILSPSPRNEKLKMRNFTIEGFFSYPLFLYSFFKKESDSFIFGCMGQSIIEGCSSLRSVP